MKRNGLTKAMALLLAVCLCFAMTACGGSEPDSSDDQTPGTSNISTDEADSTTTLGGDNADATTPSDDPDTSDTDNATGTDTDADVDDPTGTVADSTGDPDNTTSGGNGIDKPSTTTGDKNQPTTGKKPSTTTGNKKTDPTKTTKTTTAKPTATKTTKPGDVQQQGGGLGEDTGEKLADDKIVDMGGYKFTILSPLLPPKLNKNSTLFEENLHARIDEVEKEYNCQISILNSPYPDMETIKTYIVAGKKVADLLELTPYQMVAAKELGYIVPWDSQKIIDVEDPRWCDSYTKLGYYDGKQYGLQFTRPEEVRYCVVFNKTLLKANGYDPDSLYDMVNNGTWTFDKFEEICVKVTKDTNNDGKADQYGFCGIPNYISWGLISANGANCIKKSGDKMVSNFTDNKVVTALNFYDKLVNTRKVMYTNNAETTANPWDTINAVDTISHFLKGNTAFLLHESWVLNQQVKPRANFDYGMLPYPKGPNASGYVSDSMNARVMCLTATNKSADKTAIIFNALARPVDDQLDWTADVQADYFQKNDKNSIKMYDLCLRNVTYDPARAVNEVTNELNAVFANTIFGRTTTPAAGLGAIGNKLDAAIDALFNKKK